MDPLTQGVVAAVVAQQPAKQQQLLLAMVLGFIAGLAPDIDVLIRSNIDPLLFLEYHRQFTHSLFFIPFGGGICAIILHWLIAKRAQFTFLQTYCFCTLGYATHGLLDSCTTYGTQLLWPFSDLRIAWNNISIIDPLFTIPLLGLLIWVMLKRKKWLGHLAFIWMIVYLSFGVIQRERAEAAGWQLAAANQLQPIKLEAKPSFANLLVWKIITTTKTHYHVDAVQLMQRPKFYPGDKIAKLALARDFPQLDKTSQQAKDIERFRWFSNNYLAKSPDNPNQIIDIRYSMIPNQVRGLWSIELNPFATPDTHVKYIWDRNRNRQQLQTLWHMIIE